MQIEVETVDRTGTFLGSLWESKTNMAVVLLEAGLAKLQTSFGADRMADAHLLAKAEQSAKQQKLKVIAYVLYMFMYCSFCWFSIQRLCFLLSCFRYGRNMLRVKKLLIVQALKTTNRKKYSRCLITLVHYDTLIHRSVIAR